MNSTTKRVLLCHVSEVPVGGAIKVEAADLALAVFNIDGRIYVTNDACTHGPGSLSEGNIEGDVVECNFHNGAFHIPTGAVAAPPCMIPVQTYAVTVEDDQVYIDPSRSSS